MKTDLFLRKRLLFLFWQVFKCEGNRLLHICECLFDCFSLRVATVKSRARYPKTTRFIFLNDNRKLMGFIAIYFHENSISLFILLSIIPLGYYDIAPALICRD